MNDEPWTLENLTNWNFGAVREPIVISMEKERREGALIALNDVFSNASIEVDGYPKLTAYVWYCDDSHLEIDLESEIRGHIIREVRDDSSQDSILAAFDAFVGAFRKYHEENG